MTWTLTNFIIETAAGLVGGHAIVALGPEYSPNAVGRSIAGALGGAFSGGFLQMFVATLVDANGNINPDPDLATQWFTQAAAGLAAGAIATMAVGIASHAIRQHQPEKD